MTSRGAKYWKSGTIPLIAPDILGNIITEVADIGIVVDETGAVLSVLIDAENDMFGRFQSIDGEDIRSTLAVESVAKLDERLETFKEATGPVRPIELNHIDKNGRSDFPVRYSLHRIGPEGAILMLGRDLRPVAEMQQQLVRAQLALEQDYEAHREFDTRFRVLMESTSEGFLFVSVQNGAITEANSAAATLLGRDRDATIGAELSNLLAIEGRSDPVDSLCNEALADTSEPVLLDNLAGQGQLSVVPTLFRVSGERMLLCRLTNPDQKTSKTDSLNDNLRGLYHNGPDAMVFTTVEGRILSANEGFLNLIGVAHDVNVRGNSIADYLKRGLVDLKVMAENTHRSGKMKLYATKVASLYGSPRDVEISVATLQAGADSVLAFVMREAGRVDRSAAPAVDDGMRSVVELVGSATLKEIVSETTNVVEKMCIETAVELTMNNRVAAAEMLGLSRQSLYVKLRKFDLISRDTD